MAVHIKKSIDRSGVAAIQKSNTLNSMPHPKTKLRREWDTLREFGILTMLAVALSLSVKSDYLFFKEMLVACSIIGMIMALKTLRHPAIIISNGDNDRAHLN